MTVSIEFLPIIVSAICVPALVAASSIQPQDFGVSYQWNTGSLPPKYHYSYTVSIDAQGHGQVAMQASYGQSPQWKEAFQVSPAGMDSLYQVLRKNDFTTRRWHQLQQPPVGGTHRTLTITANRQNFKVADFVIKEQQASANEIYKAVEIKVPEAVWKKLEAKKQKYLQQTPVPTRN
jgi:hypothetical protein